MTKHATKLAGWTASLLALVATASAEIKLNDNFSVSGYAVGSYEYFHTKNVGSSDSLFDGSKNTPSADAAKVLLTASFQPITGVISLFYIPNADAVGYIDSSLTVLDAYVTYDAGNGITVTGGKFLSWLGYEAFDPINMSQITYGAPTGLAIPAYHTGVKVEYSEKDWAVGLAVLDSVYNGKIDKGDGEVQYNTGFEGYFTYKGIPDLTLWAGFAYDTKNRQDPLSPVPGPLAGAHSITTFDFWAQYQVTKELTIAGEFASKDGGSLADATALALGAPYGIKGTAWLAYANYAFTDKISSVFRVSSLNLSGENKAANTLATGSSGNYVQYTIGPAYKVTDNFSVRAEWSYYDFNGTGNDSTFVGVQALFRF